MSRIISFFLFLTFSLISCNSSQTNNKQVKKDATPPAVKEVDAYTAYLPSITTDEMEILWKTCNQMDYIFYELPISSSVNDSLSAQVHLRHISDSPVRNEVKTRCGKAMGRIFYKAEGEDLMDAEVYFSGGCAFFVFYKNGKATYCNLMTPDGVNHFNQLIAAASGKSPNQ